MVVTTVFTWIMLRLIFIRNGIYHFEKFKYYKLENDSLTIMINSQMGDFDSPSPFTADKDLMKYRSENDIYRQRIQSALGLFQQLYPQPKDKKNSISLDNISNSTKIRIMIRRSSVDPTHILELEKKLFSWTSKIDVCWHTPWFGHISTCKHHLRWNERNLDKLQRTSVQHTSVKVFIGDKDTMPNMIHIITHTVENKKKTMGGDYFRIFLVQKSKQFKMNINLLDLQNGEYSGVFVLPEPGQYEIHIILEYSACEGITDLPKDWFRKGKKNRLFAFF